MVRNSRLRARARRARAGLGPRCARAPAPPAPRPQPGPTGGRGARPRAKRFFRTGLGRQGPQDIRGATARRAARRPNRLAHIRAKRAPPPCLSRHGRHHTEHSSRLKINRRRTRAWLSASRRRPAPLPRGRVGHPRPAGPSPSSVPGHPPAPSAGLVMSSRTDQIVPLAWPASATERPRPRARPTSGPAERRRGRAGGARSTVSARPCRGVGTTRWPHRGPASGRPARPGCSPDASPRRSRARW